MRQKENVRKSKFFRGGDMVIRHANRRQGAWISYQLKVRGIRQADIAASVGVTQTSVNRIIYGARTSAKIRRAVAASIGFNSWNDLIAHIGQEVAA